MVGCGRAAGRGTLHFAREEGAAGLCTLHFGREEGGKGLHQKKARGALQTRTSADFVFLC